MTANDAAFDQRVLIVAPTRRDAEVTAELLERAGVQSHHCHDLRELIAQMRAGAGALMLTDIALVHPDIKLLIAELGAQPAWSDLPVLVLARTGEASRGVATTLAEISNLTILDRPTSTRSMVSASKAALRARARQYQIRQQLEEQRRAEQALRKADQKKDEFLATLAHELRNPLAPIRTGLQLLGRVEVGTTQFVRLREMMERQLQQMVKLIDELLDVSRIATGKVVLQKELVDLRAVVDMAIESSQPGIDAGSHRVEVELPAVPVRVVGDPARLAQCVGNLINNAAKYTRDGGQIRVTLAEQAGQAIVQVSDNGVGIPENMLEHVFDMFAQVNRSLDRAQGGLGIGLSLVRSLITLHGGSVAASSPGIGQGSTFTITLPACTDHALAMPTGPDAVAMAPVRPLRVLLVDDNADAADSLAQLLQAHGHETRVEYTGASALRAAASFQPDAVLCDISMPGMDGHEVASTLRRDARFATTLLVALSGRGSEQDKRQALEAGFDSQLTKPTSIENVSALLTRLQ